jgi:hypothetical protein
MRSVDDSERKAYWSAHLERALGPLDTDQLAVGVRAAVEAERSGAPAEDALWAGKAAAPNWELAREPPDPVDLHNDWEAVTIVDADVASVLKAALETAGIPVVLQRGVGWVLGLTVGPAGEVSLLVPRNRVAEARELITKSRRVEFPDSD